MNGITPILYRFANKNIRLKKYDDKGSDDEELQSIAFHCKKFLQCATIYFNVITDNF